MKKNSIIALLPFIFFANSILLLSSVNANEYDFDKKPKDTTKVRKGWTFGILPSIGLDADLGFQGGLLSNIYCFGDGSTYPKYLHSIYVEAAYTTKHYGIFRLNYDSEFLIPNHRFTVDIAYLPDAMCDFYGFNGYQSKYNANWTDKNKPEEYVSRAFYKFKRDLFRFSADIQGNIAQKWYWNAGLGLLYYNIGSVNLDMLNRGKKEKNKLPDVPGLFDYYRQWGLLASNDNGGFFPYLRAGLTFDSRDRVQNTRKGIYTDFFLTYSAAFGHLAKYNSLKANFTFRHYVPVFKNLITFAYRAAIQINSAGDSPFYIDSYWNTLFIQRVLYEGLGGGNTLRGIMRNRVLSKGFAFANVEFRFKIVEFKIKKEIFHIGLVPFMDAGMVVQPYKIEAQVMATQKEMEYQLPLLSASEIPLFSFNFDKKQLYRPHFSAGLGLKIAMNDNFVLSVDWAAAFDNQDNNKWANFYVKIGYMF